MFEETLDRMVNSNTLGEDQLVSLHQAYSKITLPVPRRKNSHYLVTSKYSVPKAKEKKSKTRQ